jgi:hypothetical protein
MLARRGSLEDVMPHSARRLALVAIVTAVVACLLTVLVLAPLSPARSAEPRPTPGPLLGAAERTFLDGTRDPLGSGITAGEFSPDGTAIAFELALNIVGHWTNDGTFGVMQGELPFLPGDPDLRLAVAELRWGGNGKYVVVGVVDRFDGGHWFWRFSPDRDPRELTPDKLDGRPVFDTDTDRRSAAYVFVENGDLFVASARTDDEPEEVPTRRARDITGVTYSADGDDLYLLYDGGATLGVVEATGGRVRVIRDMTARRTGEDPSRPMASPDGRYLAWNTENAGGQTRVVPLRNPSRRPIVLAGKHWSWQPCFDDVCPKFGTPDAPPRPTATDGRPGGRPTITARWSAPAAGSRPITLYELVATRIEDTGAVVRRVDTSAPPDVRSLRWHLDKGRYRFRVRALNDVGPGAWSRASLVVRSR